MDHKVFFRSRSRSLENGMLSYRGTEGDWTGYNKFIEEKFFIPQKRSDGHLYGTNHNRYMVTDRSVYIGNLNWVGDEFVFSAGVGVVVSQQVEQNTSTVVERMRAVFERDWHSHYSKTLQPNEIPGCSAHTAKE